MTINSKATAPNRMEAIERLVRLYGDARVDHAGIGTTAAKVRAEEAMAQVLAAWHSGVTTTDPTLDERLRVAYNPDFDYGFHPSQPPTDRCLTAVGTGTTCDNCGGPASGVRSDHTLTEDAAAARAAAEDDMPAARVPLADWARQRLNAWLAANFSGTYELKVFPQQQFIKVIVGRTVQVAYLGDLLGVEHDWTADRRAFCTPFASLDEIPGWKIEITHRPAVPVDYYAAPARPTQADGIGDDQAAAPVEHSLATRVIRDGKLVLTCTCGLPVAGVGFAETKAAFEAHLTAEGDAAAHRPSPIEAAQVTA